MSTERKTLKTYFSFYRSLEIGVRMSKTDAQLHFVEVCKGKATPETIHEKIFLKYILWREEERVD